MTIEVIAKIIDEIKMDPRYSHLSHEEILKELEKMAEEDYTEEKSEMGKILEKVSQKMTFILSVLLGKPANGIVVTEEELEYVKEENRRLEKELEGMRKKLNDGYDKIIADAELTLMILTSEKIADKALSKKGFFDGMIHEENLNKLRQDPYTQRDYDNMMDYPDELRSLLQRELDAVEGFITMEEAMEEVDRALLAKSRQ